ncbi:MAG TPA: metalloregulator ArsR/SmtB family transcription factor [Gemmatimonadaceae bacterium]|nr:metalloregulator ArsR/SmtB family transcription factor [Gemmatimonadaceae bacterium]
MPPALPILDRMSALSDPTRCRLLLLLERHELTVGELCAVLQLPQSTVSRHLKVLGDEQWVAARAEGTSRRYRVPAERLDPAAKRLWNLVREQLEDTPAAGQDARRLESVLARRRTASQAFFSSAAGQWDRLRGEMFGQRADLLGLLAFLDDGWTVGDLGCGTGQLSEALAPHVRRVVAIDDSAAMLAAARKRLGKASNVELRRGELEALPADDGELDAAALSLVLHYVVEPARAVAEAARALRRGGKLVIVDLTPHDHDEYQQTMGHVWPGFAEAQLGAWLREAGLSRVRYTALPADPAAKGPALFVCAAVKEVS